ncbi:putative ATP-dependent RNA helicase DDX31 [Schistosoma japonicum]|uniref:ATP-dependent RNA helicase n=2 Tax=Schistosoma japonicum TaxID=6182 RepID=A0A4Z2DD76_SCHJA|nr:putative ATP-dependent RNA helicase DDX31 [Schistosoma japonicum]
MDDYILNISNTSNHVKKHCKKSLNKKKPSMISKDRAKSDDSALTLACPDTSVDNASATINKNKAKLKIGNERLMMKKNALQLGIHNKMSKTPFLDEIMSQPVKPKIEPVFSLKHWKDVCESLNIFPHLISCLINRFKMDYLTAIQEAALPPLVSGRDVLIRAQTGSGKTLAYAVPLFDRLIKLDPPVERKDGPLGIAVLPSRELATQTFDVFKILSQACVRIVPGLLIGGMKRKSQKASVRKGINILIGTPKRILDHMGHTSTLNLQRIQWLVIDEADRLLEMGFEQDVRHIIAGLMQQLNCFSENKSMSKIQTVLLSATLSPGVESLAGMTLKSPVRCVVGEDNLGTDNAQLSIPKTSKAVFDSKVNNVAEFSLPSGLKHFLLIVPWKLRLVSLTAFLLLKCKYHENGGKLIVFMATQDCVDFHYHLFKSVLCDESDEVISNIPVTNLSIYRLHGSMEHIERESAFNSFSASHAGVLITTDVASRGLDLASVAWVVQYHVTGGPIDYVHRVGRTARAGSHGKALLFLEPEELEFRNLLKSKVGIEMKEISLPDLLQTVLFHFQNTKHPGKHRHNYYTTVEEGVSQLFKLFLEAVDNDDILTSLSELAYISFLRSYASFSGDLRPIFTFKRLHLGHVARAFCLQKRPSDVAARVRGRFVRTDKQKNSVGEKRKHDDSNEDEIKTRKPKYSSALSFDKPQKKLTVKHTKPADLARRNMLAEYGL